MELVLLLFLDGEHWVVELVLTGNIYFFEEPMFLLTAEIYFGGLIAVDMEVGTLGLQLLIFHTHQQSVSFRSMTVGRKPRAYKIAIVFRN